VTWTNNVVGSESLVSKLLFPLVGKFLEPSQRQQKARYRNCVCVVREKRGVFGDADRFLLCFFSRAEPISNAGPFISVTLSLIVTSRARPPESSPWLAASAALLLLLLFFLQTFHPLRQNTPTNPRTLLSGRRENVTQQRKHINHGILNAKLDRNIQSVLEVRAAAARGGKTTLRVACFAYYLISSAKVLTLNPTPSCVGGQVERRLIAYVKSFPLTFFSFSPVEIFTFF